MKSNQIPTPANEYDENWLIDDALGFRLDAVDMHFISMNGYSAYVYGNQNKK